MGFFTLLERKILSYIHNRKGPNKVRIIGLLQPIRDAIKLFSKEFTYIIKSNYYYYIVTPYVRLITILIIWMVYPIFGLGVLFKFGLLYILCCIRVNTYVVIIRGWASNSIYSLLGSLRCLGQILSYEVGVFIQLIVIILLVEGIIFYDFIEYQNLINLVFLYPIFIILYITVLAELNRSPFDFVEGESELVSGFNTEYLRGFFAVLFISEYGIILFSRFLMRIIFFGKYIISIILLIISIRIIIIRACFPRFRYDYLIKIFWTRILPLSILFLLILIFLKGN